MRNSTLLYRSVLLWIALRLDILTKILRIIFNENLFPCSPCDPWIKKTPTNHTGRFMGLREGVSPDGETKGREHGGDGGQSNVDDDAPLVFRILSHDSFLLMML